MAIVSSVGGSTNPFAQLTRRMSMDDLLLRAGDHKKTLQTAQRRGLLSQDDIEEESKALSKILRRINRLGALSPEPGTLTTNQHASIMRDLDRQEQRIRELLGLGPEA